ncbi:MAG: CvpA family protein, partial [Flavobacteriales bacterium]
MNSIDIICAVILAWAAFNGFRKGFVIGFTTLVALFAGIYGAMYYNEPIKVALNEWFNLS